MRTNDALGEDFHMLSHLVFLILCDILYVTYLTLEKYKFQKKQCIFEGSGLRLTPSPLSERFLRGCCSKHISVQQDVSQGFADHLHHCL